VPEFRAYALGQKVRYRRGDVPFATMPATIKTWNPEGDPPKQRIKTTPPMILHVALTMTARTRPHGFATALQLFADDNFL
jgi:hypothetical protein